MSKKENLRLHFSNAAPEAEKWAKRNRFYHRSLQRYFSHFIPEGSRVLEIGCGTGDLLNAVKPSYGVGVDFSSAMLELARNKYPHLEFIHSDAEELNVNEAFDYIILSDILHVLWDVQAVFKSIQTNVKNSTRIIISNYNFLWEPVLRFGEWIGLKQKIPNSNWLSHFDIFNLIELEGFQVIKKERKILFPKYIPLLNTLFNKILVNLPFFNIFGLVNFIIARPLRTEKTDYSVSIIVPARNEKGNIENAVLRTPEFGLRQQFVFVEGGSSDGTYEEMLRVKSAFPDKDIIIIKQSGKGKGNAVREGFEKAGGDVLMILDADLTTPPEDLPRFYDAIAYNRGEFINGCRLVYPMEKQAMRFLNFIGNKFFSWFFTYLLGQRLKDTLCGTKVLLKKDYEKIKKNRAYFGDFDPFGDFDLLFGAARLNMKIIEIYIRYKEREYGSTQISRFKHGWLLIKMSLFAAFKIKFI
jgi:SAM-dependent methyltransferase